MAFPVIDDFLSLIYRLLQKARLRCNNAVVIRDSLRNEESKQTKNDEENREKREQLVSFAFHKIILQMKFIFT